MSTEPKISPDITRQQVILFNRILKLGLQFPFAALEAVVDTLEEGKNGKYKDDPFVWRRLPSETHVDHAIKHNTAHECERSDESHAAHAITRWLMWYETIPHPENERPSYTAKDLERDFNDELAKKTTVDDDW